MKITLAPNGVFLVSFLRRQDDKGPVVVAVVVFAVFSAATLMFFPCCCRGSSRVLGGPGAQATGLVRGGWSGGFVGVKTRFVCVWSAFPLQVWAWCCANGFYARRDLKKKTFFFVSSGGGGAERKNGGIEKKRGLQKKKLEKVAGGTNAIFF